MSGKRPAACQLRFLGFSDNRVRPGGGQRLLGAVSTCASLTRLTLASNELGDEGAAYAGLLLASNTTLTSLDLSCNGMGAGGGEALAHGLKANSSLTQLSLAGNSVRSLGIKLVTFASRKSPSLLAVSRHA